MKLSKRLKHIEQMVSPHYTHIWDCCCDHGFLGASLLTQKTASTIHFVDIVPELITCVEVKLEKFYKTSEVTWLTHCIDVSALPLREYTGKHLVIIAGVGGDLITQFITNIHQQYPNEGIDFLLCPVHHQFSLRQQLIKLQFSLLDEALIEENKRFYEILLVSSDRSLPHHVSPTGDKLWQSHTPKQAKVVQHYLEKTLNHYGRIQQGNATNVAHIIEAYQAKYNALMLA